MEWRPALLRAADEVPRGHSWVYEPKLDGFRGLLIGSRLESRNGRDLAHYFHEVSELSALLPAATVLDGEIVCPTNGGVSFEGLQRRLAGSGLPPAAFVAFDVLSVGIEDLRSRPLHERRAALEDLVAKANDTRLQVVPQTDDAEAATVWLDFDQPTGVEGVVAKRSDRPYPRPDRRDWVKVRRHHTLDAVVCGVTGRPGALRLVLGAYNEAGELWTLGLSQPIPASETAVLAPLLPSAAVAERPLPSRFEELRTEWLTLPATLVVEVDCFHLDGGRWLRQPARFLRWRPDRAPAEIRLTRPTGG